MVVFKDNAPNVAATIIILVTISLIVFPLRVYTRLKHNAWGSDDWSMLVAVVRAKSSGYDIVTDWLITVSRYRSLRSVSFAWEVRFSVWESTRRIWMLIIRKWL